MVEIGLVTHTPAGRSEQCHCSVFSEMISLKHSAVTWKTQFTNFPYKVYDSLCLIAVYARVPPSLCHIIIIHMELLFFSLKEMIKYLAMICILVNIFCTHIEYNHISSCMMTSSNGNIFRVTGPLCGELIGHRWIPPQKGQWRGALMSLGSMSWIKGWENNREAGDLRCHRAHYDVPVMAFIYSAGVYLYSWRMMCNHMYIKAFDLGFGLLERKCHQWMLLWLGIGLMCG